MSDTNLGLFLTNIGKYEKESSLYSSVTFMLGLMTVSVFFLLRELACFRV